MPVRAGDRLVSSTRLRAGLCVTPLGVLVAPLLVLTRSTGGAREDSRALSRRWRRGDHALGRGSVRPRNVDVSGSVLALRLADETLEGGEVVSPRRFGDGAFRARLRVPDLAGSLTGFFLYRPPDHQSEIDVELVNSREGRVIFSSYDRGREQHHEARLGFDPTSEFHEYGFERAPEGVRFTVDGTAVHFLAGRVPRSRMHLHVNAWWPVWLAGGPPRTDRRVLVEWVEHPAPP